MIAITKYRWAVRLFHFVILIHPQGVPKLCKLVNMQIFRQLVNLYISFIVFLSGWDADWSVIIINLYFDRSPSLLSPLTHTGTSTEREIDTSAVNDRKGSNNHRRCVPFLSACDGG